MKAHLTYYSTAYIAALMAVVMFGLAVYYPSARIAFWVLSVWFVVSCIVNAVFFRAIK